MRKKHTAPLIALAALLLVAFAAPAANAARWSQEAAPLNETIKVTFQGSVEQVTGPVSDLHCDSVVGTLTLTPGDQGEITNISYSKCVGMGLQMTVTPIGLPWAVEATSNGIFTDEVSENVKYNGSNVWAQMNSVWTLVPDSIEEVSSLTINGHNKNANSAYDGAFNLTPAGVFGIEG